MVWCNIGYYIAYGQDRLLDICFHKWEFTGSGIGDKIVPKQILSIVIINKDLINR